MSKIEMISIPIQLVYSILDCSEEIENSSDWAQGVCCGLRAEVFKHQHPQKSELKMWYDTKTGATWCTSSQCSELEKMDGLIQVTGDQK